VQPGYSSERDGQLQRNSLRRLGDRWHIETCMEHSTQSSHDTLSNRSVERVQRFVRRRTSLPGCPVHGPTYVRTGRRMPSDAETGTETALCHRALHATQQSPRAQRGQRYGCAHPLYRSAAVTQVQPSPGALLTCSCVMSQANVRKSAFPPQCTGYGHSGACRVLVCLI